MKHRLRLVHCAVAGLMVLFGSSISLAQQSSSPSSTSDAEQALEAAALQGKFTFLVFHRAVDPATQAMVQKLHQGMAGREAQASLAYVNVAEPAEKALVEKLGVSRAPLPLTMAIAPNGAITGVFSQRLGPDSVEQAIVTPAMMRSMKALQDNKIVFVCVHEAANTAVPQAVAGVKKDPLYKDRTSTVSLVATDPAEAKFLAQMKIGAASVQGVTMVVLAPPGVVVDRFDETATSSEIAAALVKAGKCCDDENCKHHPQHRATQTNTRKTTR